MGGAEDNPLIAIQDEVRDHFGWELQADIASAKSMKLAFDEAEPFGLSKWNIDERNQSLGDLQLKLLKATAVVFVGAAVESQELEEMVGDVNWRFLTVVGSSKGGPKDKTGKVEFIAEYFLDTEPHQLQERSRFKRYKGDWKYLDDKG